MQIQKDLNGRSKQHLHSPEMTTRNCKLSYTEIISWGNDKYGQLGLGDPH